MTAKTIYATLILLLSFSSLQLFAQEPTPRAGILWLTISDQSFKPDSLSQTTNQSFNSFLQSKNLQYYKQVMPWAPTERLRNIYELKCNYDESQLLSEIQSQFSNAFSYMELRYEPNPCYDPADYMWWLTTQTPTDWLWHIMKIQGNLAWDITKGDPNIKVAIIDDGVDPTHPDLISKLDPPNDFYTGGAFPVASHGTSTATLLAAETVDQGQTPNGQLASIGYNTKLMFAGWGGGTAACLYASTVLNAKIISISWYYGCSSSANDLLIEQQINDNGTTIFRAAGNGSGNCGGGKLYPFSGLEDPRTIVVTSSDKDDHHQNINPGGATNSHYPEVDICSPGYCLLAGIEVSANPTWPYYGCWGGTSQSTPIAAGVGALILSVNGCLTSTSIQDIIKSTADPIVDAANYPGQVGAGRINAYQSVLAAQSMYSSSLDLFMKDTPHDFGVEPNPDNGPMWISDDIWVRNQNDGFVNQVHQNPEYWINPAVDNYVYVRIRNKSCSDFISTPADLLHLHWAKAASALSWPSYWNGTAPPCTGTISMGNEVPSSPLQIPNIPAGGEVILEFPWHVPFPDDYNICNPEPWHFCLLSRIDSPQDPMTFPEIASVYDNAKNNNNIAWKNLTVVNILPGIAQNGECQSDRIAGGTIAVGNPFEDAEDNYKLEFKLDENNRGIPIFEQAEIKLTLDELSWEKWMQGGQQQENIRIKRVDCRQLIITGNPAYLKNLAYERNERSTMHVSFNFLTNRVDQIPQFDYHVIQHTTQGEKIIGGELYRIRKPTRDLFGADGGGDRSISEGASTTLTAASIGESAYYNWYDEEGNLIYSGNSLTVSPEITTKYKLEVIALSDGFLSYDSLTVNIKDCEIQSITPNPATTQITVQYKAENVSSAYLVITHPSGTPNDNYIINLSQNTKIISTSNYTTGNYNLILICDGQIKDTKVLSIQ